MQLHASKDATNMHTQPVFITEDLSSCLGNVAESLYALVCDSLPVLGSNHVLGEELRAHTNAVNTSLDPRSEVLLVGRNTASNHEL